MLDAHRDDLILLPDSHSLVERPERSYACDYRTSANLFFRVSKGQVDALHRAFGNSARPATSRSRPPYHPELLHWGLYRPGIYHTQCRNLNDQLWVRDTRDGWVIDRTSVEHPDQEFLLAFILGRFPLLLPNAYSAKLLAQTCYPRPPAELETVGWL